MTFLTTVVTWLYRHEWLLVFFSNYDAFKKCLTNTTLFPSLKFNSFKEKMLCQMGLLIVLSHCFLTWKSLLFYFSDGQNVACPVAILHEDFSPESVIRNFIPFIRHLSGSSARDVIECHRHKSFQHLRDKNDRIKNYENNFLQMTKEEQVRYINQILAKNSIHKKYSKII